MVSKYLDTSLKRTAKQEEAEDDIVGKYLKTLRPSLESILDDPERFKRVKKEIAGVLLKATIEE